MPDLAMPDLAPPPDLTPLPDLENPFGIGWECPNGNECLGGLTCLGSHLDPSLPASGYCTKQCMKDDDCGAGAFCGPPVPNAGNLCWLRCTNGACASPHQVCSRYLSGQVDLVNMSCTPGNSKAQEGSPCKNFGDCNGGQVCINNPIDWPGGACITTHCTPGDSTTCVPGGSPVCLASGNGAICLPGCGTDADCRHAEGYRCVPIPNSNLKACVVPNPIGNNCKMQSDCNGGAPWTCITNMMVPNGYCSIVGCDAMKQAGCPTGAYCVSAGMNTTICLKTCSGNNDCAMGTTCKPIAANVMGCAP